MRAITRLLMLAVMLAGAAAAAPEKTVSDDEIYDQVRRRLTNDPEIKGGHLQVEVQKGVVVIRGKVDKDKHRERATRVAKKVQGVKNVVNELTVDPAR